MQFGRKLRLAMTIGAVASSLSLGLIAPTISGAAAPSGTITFAEGPGANPNYIFPYVGCQFFSVDNLNQFQELMFRPVYWFGLAGSSAVQYKLSTANAPVFSNGNKTITINMKGWKFADGQTVDAEAVMFFLNMYKADPTSYCGYNGGFGIPDQVKSASGKGNKVTINFTTSVNPGWILYNYLSELTPMPNAWDRTSATQTSNCASGAYGAASTTVACKNVEAYLDGQSSKTSTYTDKMWQSGVDGPWKLTAFDSLGNATFHRRFSPHRRQVLVRRVPTGVNSRVATTSSRALSGTSTTHRSTSAPRIRSLLQSRSSTSARRCKRLSTRRALSRTWTRATASRFTAHCLRTHRPRLVVPCRTRTPSVSAPPRHC